MSEKDVEVYRGRQDTLESLEAMGDIKTGLSNIGGKWISRRDDRDEAIIAQFQKEVVSKRR